MKQKCVNSASKRGERKKCPVPALLRLSSSRSERTSRRTAAGRVSAAPSGSALINPARVSTVQGLPDWVGFTPPWARYVDRVARLGSPQCRGCQIGTYFPPPNLATLAAVRSAGVARLGHISPSPIWQPLSTARAQPHDCGVSTAIGNKPREEDRSRTE